MATTPEPLPIPEPAKVAPAEVPGLGTLVGLVVGVVVVAALYLGRDVLVPIMLAVLLSFILAPLVGLLRRVRLGRVPAVAFAVLFALGVILSLGALIGTQVAHLAADAPRYAETVREKLADLRSSTIGRLPERLGQLRAQLDGAEKAAPAAAPTGAAARAPVPVVVEEPDAAPLEVARAVLEPILAPIETTVIVLVVTIFILLQREDLRDRLIRLFGATDLHRTTTAMDEAAARLSRYFVTQLALNTGFGVLVAVGLYFIGVPAPLLWGIVAGLMRFIPYIGAFIAALPPLLLATAVDPGWSMAIWTVALFAFAEPLMGYVVEPLVYGHSTGLSPVSVIVAAIFWTWLWGPIGLILSTPLTLCLVVLGRHVERLEFLDVLLGDRPALTPIESFYQRMLAGDPDEVLEQAELLLKERSLSAYYDEVALKALQLAAADAARGALPAERLNRVRDAIRALIADLADAEDVEPVDAEADADDELLPPSLAERSVPKGAPPVEAAVEPPAEWAAPGAVLCVAGRGPLDEAAAAMLAQLLCKHGLGARTVPHEAVSRERLGALDPAGVRLICISYLELTGAPSHLRYLLRRLRRQFPGVPTLVGLWPADDAILTDDGARSMLRVDHRATSLHEAVETALAEAQRAPGDAVRAAAE